MATTTIYNELIGVNAVSGTAIADNAVTSVHIAQNNVGTVQLALNSVTSVSIALNQVTGTQIANNAITSTQLADNAVTATKVPDGTQFALGATTFSSSVAISGAASGAISEGLLVDYSTNLARFLTYDSSTGSDIAFYTQPSGGSTTERVRIDSAGKVGIGVSPSQNFNLSAAGTVEARFASTDDDAYLQISSDTDEGKDSVLQFLSGTSARGSIVYDHNTTAASQSMTLKTGDNAVSAMTIDGSGNVGIGTTTVRGTNHIKNAGNNWEDGLLLEGDSGNKGWNFHTETSGELLIGYNAATNAALTDQAATTVLNLQTDGQVGINVDPTAYLDVRAPSGVSAPNVAYFKSDQHGLGVYVNIGSTFSEIRSNNNSYALVLNASSGGNVGIGTTSPQGLLHIQKDASETNLIVQSNTGGTGSAVGGRLRLQLGAQSNSGSGNADTQSGDTLGQIMFEGQGTDYSYQGGNIKTLVTTGDGDDNRSNQATAMTFETIDVGSVSPAERMRITSSGLHTTGGLHTIHSSTPNNFVAGCSADTWYDIDNYNYQNNHNGAGVDETTATITQLVWQNGTTVYGYIVRLYILHGAYSANTHTLYSSAGTDGDLNSGHSFARFFGELYDVGGNGAVVWATGHTDIDGLKVAIRFNNHTGTAYNPLTMQIKTNGPPSAGTGVGMRVWRL